MEIISSRKQKVWGTPVVYNFIFGGLGGGLFIFYVLLQASLVPIPVLINLSAILMILTGLGAVSLESQHPFRGIYILNNLATSWMSREALAATVFILLAFANMFYESKALAVSAAIAALTFVLSQGILVYKSRAISAWHNTNIPVLFLTTALCNGGAIIIIFSAAGFLIITENTMIMLVIFLCLNFSSHHGIKFI